MKFKLPLVLFWSALLLSPFAVFADPDPPSKTVVLLIEAEQFIGSEDAVAAIRSQLNDLPVRFRIERLTDRAPGAGSLETRARELADSGSVAAVIWLDPENSRRVHFLLTDEGGSSIFDRGLREDEIAPVQTESLALILRATIQALLEGELAVPPPAPDESLPPDPQPSTSRPDPEPEREDARDERPLLGLETAYAYRAYSRDVPAVSGFHAGLHLCLGSFARVFLDYEIRQPLNASGTCVETSVRAHPITAGGRLLWQRGRWLFGPALGVTLDIATYEATTSCYQVDAYNGRQRVNFSVAPAFFVAVLIYKRLSLFLSAEADIMWRAGRYTAPSDAGDQEVLLEPLLVQPGATAGLSVELL